MAEVTFQGLGPPVVVPADDGTEVRLVPGEVQVPSGQLAGVVATFYPGDVVQGVSNAAPEFTTTTFFSAAPTMAPFAPLSVGPHTSPVLAGPMSAVAPFASGTTMGFMPGTLDQLLEGIGNNAEFAQLPGVSPGMNTPLETDQRDVVTLKRGMRIVFTDDPLTAASLRGQSFDIINFEKSVNLGSTGTIRDVLTLRSAVGVPLGTRDTFRIMGRQLTRNSPVLEIILG